ncbi:MAG TPA: isoprenylcysteine carboxylmethyltransferase family protein [Terriglobia bacterium]|jgi:protein-S-isoprenylcysteine O-methyltransferase Ste14|nr:isoprenylcysteine carboxylmethyltransferase family protein [Terriglobia bacterium]
MTDDVVFRVGLVAVSVPAPLIQTYFGRRARPHQAAYGLKRAAFFREGRFNFILHATLVFGMAALIGVYAASPRSLRWCALPIPALWRWFGLILAVLALLGLVEVHRQLGRYWSAYLELQENHGLITSGLYSRIRHPMYTMISLHMIALSMVSANWLLTAVVAARLVLFFRRMGREEAMLTEHFGDRYRRYMQRTGRLLPRLRGGGD